MRYGKRTTTMILAVAIVGTASCKRETGAEGAALASSSASVSPAPTASPSATASHAAVHDPSNPPIDCPLRKHGINPHEMKPFDDVEKYIAFLERADRAGWQKPDVVVDALGLEGTEVVADVGAGSGYFTFRFAKELPKGRVLAIDIEPEMIRHIHHKAMMDGVSNVGVEIAKADDPSVPKEADWVFVCDVLHHVKDRAVWLSRMQGQMKPGAKVVLIEFKEGELPEGPPESLKVGKQELVRLMSSAGFKLVKDEPDLLPYQHLLIFES